MRDPAIRDSMAEIEALPKEVREAAEAICRRHGIYPIREDSVWPSAVCASIGQALAEWRRGVEAANRIAQEHDTRATAAEARLAEVEGALCELEREWIVCGAAPKGGVAAEVAIAATLRMCAVDLRPIRALASLAAEVQATPGGAAATTDPDPATPRI